jgi:hypothetical protein
MARGEQKKEALSEIAMTAKPRMSQLGMILQVERDYFRHAARAAYWSGLGLLLMDEMGSLVLSICKVNN